MKKKRAGFSLLELAIVLTVLSLMLGGILAALTQEARLARKAELDRKLAAIEEALLSFRKAYDRLPCPADFTVTPIEANFGKESGTIGDCTDDLPAEHYDGVNSVVGVLPVTALNLPDDYAFDPWGGRFTYAVDRRATGTGAFTTYPVTDSSIGSLIIKDAAGNTRLSNAIAVVLTHGPNGHGAWQAEAVRKQTGTTNANEAINCHCESDGDATAFDAIFIQAPGSQSVSAITDTGFDDSLRYYLRSSLLSAADSDIE